MAISVNTILGTAWLTHFFTDVDSILIFFLWGIFFGAIASFPIFLLLIFIINQNVSKSKEGKTIFTNVLLTGFISSAIIFVAFFYCCHFVNEDLILFLNTLLASFLAVFSQKKSLVKLGHNIEFDTI
jgi:hypothetical protein